MIPDTRFSISDLIFTKFRQKWSNMCFWCTLRLSWPFFKIWIFFRKIFIFHDFGWSLMKISKKKIFQYFQYSFVGRLWVHIRVQIWNIILIGQSKAKKHPFFGFFRNFENSNRLVKFHKNWVKIMKWVFLMLIPSIWNVFAKLNFFPEIWYLESGKCWS